MVQVTANLSYHHVTLIPAPTAKNSYTESTLPSHGAQEYSPNPESIPQTYDQESSDDDSLSNDVVLVAAFEKQPEVVPAPRDEVQPLLSVETKERRRSYASITAGKTIINENPYKPSEEEAEGDKPLEEEANSVKPSLEEEANSVKPSEEEDAKDNNNPTSQVDVAYDINGFTTVVSSKSKKKAKAEAKAAAIAARKKMFNKHRRCAERDEHDKQHHRTDGRAGREHAQHAKGGPRDGAKGGPRDGDDKHHGRVVKDIGQRHI